jgi:hypothetical protein
MPRKILNDRRGHIVQKVCIGAKRTFYVSVDSDTPSEIFIRVKGKGTSVEVVSLYDTIARLASLALQHHVPLEDIGELLLGTKYEPSGPVTDHAAIKFCNSPTDFIGRHLLVEFCNRQDLAHVKRETT